MAVALAAPAPAAEVRHDFDPATLASYLSLRFSSAVPPTVIQHVLAAEGFSQRDLDLVAASPSTSGGSPAAAAAASAAALDPSVSFAQPISQDTLPCPSSDPTPCELDTQIEPDIAVNPANANNLVGVFQQGRFQDGASVDPGWATSFDGGQTWPFHGDAPKLTVAVGGRFARASDPAVAFDRKHKAVLLNTIAVVVKGCAIFCDSALVVNPSSNGGRTFGSPVVLHEDSSDPNGTTFVFNDKNWIVTDNNPGSPHYGRTYVVWDQVRCDEPTCTVVRQPVVLRYSDDGGKTWSPLIQATADEQPGSAHQRVGVQPVVEPNGHVVISYADAAPSAFTFEGTYKAIRSTDGGNTWSAPRLIDGADPAPEEANSLRAPNIPAMVGDGAGKLYLVFQDQRFGPGRNDVVLETSTDEGQSWSPAVNATPGELGLDHFTPAVAVAGGQVHLTYRTHTPTNVNADPAVHAVYRALTTAGAPSGAPLELYAPSDASVAAFSTLAGQRLRFFGDYAGIAASPTAAHPIWDQAQNFAGQAANPTNTHQRSFSALVQ